MDPERVRDVLSDRPVAEPHEAPRVSAPTEFDENVDAPPLDERGPQTERIDWNQDDNPYKAQAQALEAQRQEQQQQFAQAQYAQAMQLWQQAEVEQERRTAQMDAFEANESNKAFYKARADGATKAYTQLQNQTAQYHHYLGVTNQAKDLLTKYRLDEGDADSLIAIGALDPSRMEMEAQRRARAQSRVSDLEERLNDLETGRLATNRIRSGADRFGGGGGGGRVAAPREFTGSDEELWAALEADGVLEQLRGR